MDFERSSDQVALVDAVAAYLDGRFAMDAVRGSEALGGVDRGRWRELGEMGVFDVGEVGDVGTEGLGWADAVLVFEQLGRALVPGPLVASALAGALVDGAATGARVVGLLERDVEVPYLVEFPSALDDLLVLDVLGVWRVDPQSLDSFDVAALDPLTPVARVDALPQGEQVAGPDVARAFLTRGAVLTSALQLGLATGACDLATVYAKERQQFGKPIGMFQAVKHLCADMASRVEVCRAIVYFAGVCLDDADAGDTARARRPPHACSRSKHPRRTRASASRCTEAWASRGKSTPTCSPSARMCSRLRSVRPKTTKKRSRSSCDRGSRAQAR